MDYEVIDIHDERAKELAQILSNEKALSILKLIEERPRSISEISRELGIPISTVSYHIDRMLKVGLVEVAGKKYGKRLQEVKLYRASSKPILILPGGKKKHRTWEKLRVINLAVSAVASTGMYFAVKLLMGGSEEQSETVRTLTVKTAKEASKSSLDWIAVIIAILTFILVFGVLEYRFRKRFLRYREDFRLRGGNMAEITVGQVVKRKAVLVRPDDTIHKVARILARNKVGSAVVVDENEEIVGIITDRDILDKVVAKGGKDPKKVLVKDVMTTKPVTIEDDYTIRDAIDKMMDKGIRRLLVTRVGKPIGFVTAADLLAALNSMNSEEEEEVEEETEVYGICEVCGQYGPLYKVYIEGGEKWVCESCKDSLNL